MCSSETGFSQIGAVLAVDSSCEGLACALLTGYLLLDRNGSELTEMGVSK